MPGAVTGVIATVGPVTGPVIAVEDLVKVYGDRRAVDGVSFQVAAGEVYGLLGPNGAGKSTTVEILEGHRRPTSGAARVLGVDPDSGDRDVRDRTGIVLQTSGLELKLSVREILTLYASCYRRPRTPEECAELVGLTEALGRRVEMLSGGQRRRLDLAVGIVGRPEVLFLDEPTTGFDPAARRGAWELVRALCSVGTTVLLTSHYLDEVEHLADRVGVLVGGRLVAEGTPESLTAGAGRTVVRFGLPDGVAVADLPREIGRGAVGTERDRVELSTATPTATVHALTGWALARGYELADLTVTRPTLEDTFLRLVGEVGEPDEPGEPA